MRLMNFKVLFVLFASVFSISSLKANIRSDAYIPEINKWFLTTSAGYEKEKIEYDKADVQDYEKQEQSGALVLANLLYRLNKPVTVGFEVGKYPYHKMHKSFADSRASYSKKDSGMAPFKVGAIWRFPDDSFEGLQRDLLVYYSLKMPSDLTPYGQRRAHDFYLAARFSLSDEKFDATGLFYLKFTKSAETYNVENGKSVKADNYSGLGAKFSAQYLFYKNYGLTAHGGIQRDANHEVWGHFANGAVTNGWQYSYGAGLLNVLSEKSKIHFQFSKEEGYYFLTVQGKRDKIEIEHENYFLSISYAF